MFRNVGGKLKVYALIYFCVMTALTVITGILLIPTHFIYGLLVTLLGPCSSLASSWFIYGFAEIIDKVTAIEENTHKDEPFK